jgi:hypothetical protein
MDVRAANPHHPVQFGGTGEMAMAMKLTFILAAAGILYWLSRDCCAPLTF